MKLLLRKSALKNNNESSVVLKNDSSESSVTSMDLSCHEPDTIPD